MCSLPALLLSLLAAVPVAAQAPASPDGVPLGLPGGTVQSLAFAPSDARVVYAGAAGGGVFVSGDGGRSWRSSTGSGGELAGRDVPALAVDPQSPDVAYAATADGVWKTASGGASWVAFPKRLAGLSVLVLAVDPRNRQVVYAGTDRGVFRSDDGGRHWAARSAGLPPDARVLALDVDPAVPGQLFAGVVASFEAQLFRSRDGGATWSAVAGLPTLGVWGGLARASRTLYVAGSGILYRSDDDGATWARAPGTDQLLEFPQALATDAAGTLYVSLGTLGVQASADRGASLTYLGNTSPNGVIRPFGVVTVLAAAAPGQVLAGTAGGGVFRRRGGTFVASSRGLTAARVTGLEVDPADSAHLYASDATEGLFESRDAGVTWRSKNEGLPVSADELPLFDVQALALLPGAPERLYAGFSAGVARSSDGGTSWSYTEVNECATPSVLAADPRAPVLYAGARLVTTHGCTLDCFAFASRDGGRSWGCLPGIYQLYAVVVAPGRSSVVYVAGDNTMWKSADRGLSFAPAGQGLGPAAVISLGISPAAPQALYAGAVEGGVWKSEDGAAHWAATGALPAGPVVALAVDPTDAGRVYAAVRGAGLFASRDGGATWQPLGASVPAAVLSGPLKLAGAGPGPRTLYVGTAGSGAWAVAVP